MITLEHQQQWCAEAGAKLATEGCDHGIYWRIGPEPGRERAYYVQGEGWKDSPATSHCKVCELEIEAGQTVVQTHAQERWGWRHVRCFDWSTYDLGDLQAYSAKRPTGQPGYNRREISAKQAAKELLKVVPNAPARFRIEAATSQTPGIKLDTDQAALLAAVKVVEKMARVAPTVKTKPAPKAPKAIAPKPKLHRAFGIAAPAPIIEEIPVTTTPTEALPEWAEEWLAGLIFEPKRDYARALLEHLLNGAPAPAHPGTEWADKAHKRASRLIERAAA